MQTPLQISFHQMPTIPALEPNLEYRRIATDDGRDIYVHRNSVIGGMERLRLETEVRFHEEAGDAGPQASTVEPIGEHGHHTQ